MFSLGTLGSSEQSLLAASPSLQRLFPELALLPFPHALPRSQVLCPLPVARQTPAALERLLSGPDAPSGVGAFPVVLWGPTRLTVLAVNPGLDLWFLWNRQTSCRAETLWWAGVPVPLRYLRQLMELTLCSPIIDPLKTLIGPRRVWCCCSVLWRRRGSSWGFGWLRSGLVSGEAWVKTWQGDSRALAFNWMLPKCLIYMKVEEEKRAKLKCFQDWYLIIDN